MSAELMLGIVSACAVIVAGYWGLAKMLVRQFESSLDRRFATLETSWAEWRKRIETKQEDLERDVRRILIELPREYVSRSDYVRRETVIEGKIDQLGLRLQNWILERDSHV